LESLTSWLPLIGLAAWVLAGRWQEAGLQARNWTNLMTALCLALLIPLPSRASLASSRAPKRIPARAVVALAWTFLVGLVYLTG
jgi:hypothetical protein